MGLFGDSSALSADDARRTLTLLLLSAPHRPGAGLWNAAAEVMPAMEGWGERPPVVGVMTREREEGPPQVMLLVREDTVDAEAIQHGLGWDLPIETLVTGEFEPAGGPALGGDSISGDVAGGETGTLCCLVENARGDRFAMGCNHTLAGVNRGVVGRDTVLQPGAQAGGARPGDTFGTLTDVKTIALGGFEQNRVDAALVRPARPSAVDPGIRGFGPIRGMHTLDQGDRVEKVGWGSGHTFGTAEFRIGFVETFSSGEKAQFVDQHAILGDGDGMFAQRGDSGAAVLREGTAELVGMVIAVSPRARIAVVTPITSILAGFEVLPVA